MHIDVRKCLNFHGTQVREPSLATLAPEHHCKLSHFPLGLSVCFLHANLH